MIPAEHHMMVAYRGLQEVLAADVASFNLHRDLRAAEALLVWVSGESGLAEELPAQVSAQLEDCCRTLRHLAMDGDSDARFEMGVE